MGGNAKPMMRDALIKMLCCAFFLLPNYSLGLFDFNTSKLSLEKVMFDIDEDVNNNSAIEVHIVIVYESEKSADKIGLAHSLKNTNSRTYFSKDFLDQLKKDNPDRLVIYKFTFVAEARITNWIEIKYENDHMTPVCGIVFANYSCGNSGTGGNDNNNSSNNGDNNSGNGDTKHSANCYRAEIPSECKKMKIILHKTNFALKYREEDTDEDEEEEIKRLKAEKKQVMEKNMKKGMEKATGNDTEKATGNDTEKGSGKGDDEKNALDKSKEAIMAVKL
jgi:hypothetical protein